MKINGCIDGQVVLGDSDEYIGKELNDKWQ